MKSLIGLLFFFSSWVQASECDYHPQNFLHPKPRLNCETHNSNGVVAQYNSWGLREDRVLSPQQQKGKFRILVLGPGLETDAIALEQLGARRLEEELNKGSSDLSYEILNGALDGLYSSQNLLLLKQVLEPLAPDLVLYYQTSRNIPMDLLEFKKFSRNEDDFLDPRPCDPENFDIVVQGLGFFSKNQDFLCKAQAVISVQQEIKKIKPKPRVRFLEQTLKEINQNFSSMNLILPNKKRDKTTVLVMLAPESITFSQMIFRSYGFEDLALYFLSPHLKMPGTLVYKASAAQGYYLLAAPSSFRELYTSPYLMKDSAYIFNSAGQARWAEMTAKILKPYIASLIIAKKRKEPLPLNHVDNSHEEPSDEDPPPSL